MPAPLAVVAPAAAASLAYLNARTSFWYDRLLFASIFSGLRRVLWREYRDHLNLFYVLEDHAQNPSTANKDLLIFEGKHLTYAAFYDRVLRVGNWLTDRIGILPHDIVALDLHNSDTFVVIWWALWSIGAKPAFINYNLRDNALAHSIRTSNAKVCLVDSQLASHVDESLRAELDAVNFVVLTPDLEAEALACHPIRRPDSDRQGELLSSMAMLIYTSGTTGLPKPAVVAWSKCIVGGSVAQGLVGRGSHDTLYTSMPLYHSSAAILGMCSTVLAGSTLALGRRFSTKTFWSEVRASNATSIQYVGETLRYLLAAPPERDAETGEDLDRKHGVTVAFGNGLRPDIWNQFKERFGVETIVEFYAATEGPFATWNISRNDLTAGAVGRSGWLLRLIQSFHVALVKVDFQTDMPWRDPKTGRCRRVRSSEPGEMLYRLPSDDLESRFQGYYGNPEATASKVMRDVFSKGDAWFRTGDVIRRDRDGRIFFSDRIGDTFRWKSENVSTGEVSDAVGTHPAVREANVYGVQLPHHDGRAGCVAICFNQYPPPPQTLSSLAAHVEKTLPRFARPLFLRVLPDVGGDGQTTGTNKQQKHKLREAGVRPGAAAGDLYWLRRRTYVPFNESDWRALEAGRVKL